MKRVEILFNDNDDCETYSGEFLISGESDFCSKFIKWVNIYFNQNALREILRRGLVSCHTNKKIKTKL